MVVRSKKIVNEFIAKHSNSREVVLTAYAILKAAQWKNLNEAKQQTANSLDYVGNDRYVYNVGGNDYRFIVMIFFRSRNIYIRGIFTHAQYNKLTTKQIESM